MHRRIVLEEAAVTSTIVVARPIDPVAAHVYVTPVVRELPPSQPVLGSPKGW